MIVELRQKVIDFWDQELNDAAFDEVVVYSQLIDGVETISKEARKEYHQVLEYRDMLVRVSRGLHEVLLKNKPRRATS